MISATINRLALLRHLLEFSEPIGDLADCLAQFDWDYEGERVTLTREHLRSVLRRFLLRELSAAEVESWANQIEGREDIDFESGFSDLIGDMIFDLANPDLVEHLTECVANEMINKITG